MSCKEEIFILQMFDTYKFFSGTMSTIRPRGVTRGGPGSREDSSIFRIDV